MMTRGYPIWLLAFWLLVMSLLNGCSPDFDGMGEQRLALSQQEQGNIEIVAMQTPGDNDKLLNGILLAAEEINLREGKLLGRNLKVHIEQEGDTFEATKSTIRRVVANPRVAAVLGHRRSSIAVPASAIYEHSKVVFMTPFATAKNLTGHSFQYVFRMIPSNEVMADQLASVAKTLGYQRVVTLYARDDLNRETAFLFEDAAINQGIKLVKSSSFFEKDRNYRPIISQFNNESFDAIFIASSAPAAALMVKQLREMGIQEPILGSNSLNQAAYTDNAGSAAENTIIPSIYHPDEGNPVTRQFIRQYREKYQTEPDYNAAQGYDSVMLLAAAIEKAGSTLPPLLSTTLHYMPAWVGVTGIHAFDEYGDVNGKKYFFKVWQEQAWQDMPAIHVPYLIDRFTQNQKTQTNFPKAFTRRMHDDEHNTYLLELAQNILKFNRIGIIYENTEDGRKASGYELLQTLENQHKLSIVGCEVPFSLLDTKKTEQALLACYGTLSLNTDALLAPSFHGIDSKLQERLNSSLTFFKIPAISLDERNTDPNISLVLTKRTDVDAQGISGMHVYSSLLKGLKVHEFAERLKNLPELTVNLHNLQYQGFSEQPILELSPDNYLYSDSPLIRGDTMQ
ncbi:MAG: ABC transporter substrate-binding protein [Thiothrix sp.]